MILFVFGQICLSTMVAAGIGKKDLGTKKTNVWQETCVWLRLNRTRRTEVWGRRRDLISSHHFIPMRTSQSEFRPITSWKNKIWQNCVANHPRLHVCMKQKLHCHQTPSSSLKHSWILFRLIRRHEDVSTNNNGRETYARVTWVGYSGDIFQLPISRCYTMS